MISLKLIKSMKLVDDKLQQEEMRVLEKCLNDTEASVRIASFRRLLLLGESYLPLLEQAAGQALSDPNEQIRAYAAEVVEKLKNGEYKGATQIAPPVFWDDE